MGKVTDPALLAALDAESAAPAAPGKVSDPALLAQLEGQPQPPAPGQPKGRLVSALDETYAKAATPRTLLPGLWALFKGTPENAAEHAATDTIRNADPRKGGLVGAVDAFNSTPMAALTYAPMGTPQATLVKPTLAARAASSLEEKAIEQGRKVLTGNQGSISVKKPLSPEAVRVALEEGAIGPLGTTKRAASVLSDAREAMGQRYADLIDALEQKGVTGPNAHKLALDLLTEADAVSARTLGSPKPGMLRDIAAEVVTKPTTGTAPGADLGLSQAESMKRALQHEAATEYDKLLNKMRPLGEAKVAAASRVRQAIEDAVQAQASKAPAEAAAFEPVKERLSRIIEASNAADTAAARQSRNQGISLSDTVAGTAGAAAGGFSGAAGLTMLNKLARTRGPATAAWAADRGAKLLSKLPQSKTVTPIPPEAFTGLPGMALGRNSEAAAMLRELYQRLSLTPASAEDDRTGR